MYLYLCSQYVYISALFIWSRFFPPQEWMIALVKIHSTEGVERRHLFREIKSLYGAFPSVVRYTSRFNWILSCSPPPAPIARIKPRALWLFYRWVPSGPEPPLIYNNHRAGWIKIVSCQFVHPKTGPWEWLTECFQDRECLVIWEIKGKSTVYTVK